MAGVSVFTVQIEKDWDFEGTVLVQASIHYPRFTSRRFQTAVCRMNRFYEESVQSLLTYIQKTLYPQAFSEYQSSEAGEFPFRMYEVVLTFVATYNQQCVASLYMDQYVFTGGAHGNTLRTSQTWSLKSGAQLSLRALFPGNRWYVRDIKTHIDAQIAQRLEEDPGTYFDDYPELVEQTFNQDSYFLTPDALAVYFQQYDIAPYSTGIPVFYIPYAQVGAKVPTCV